MRVKLILAALVLVAVAAPASAASSVCLRHSDVDGWGARDKKSMVVSDRFGRRYLVSLNGLCDDLNFSFGMGFRAPGGMMNMGTCVDRGDRVVMRGGGASLVRNDTCWVQKVQPYTKEMEQADKLARQNKQPLNTY